MELLPYVSVEYNSMFREYFLQYKFVTCFAINP